MDGTREGQYGREEGGRKEGGGTLMHRSRVIRSIRRDTALCLLVLVPPPPSFDSVD